jgi:hypothetical protein
MIEIFDNVVQGSDEWRDLRLGLPTASNFGDILAKARTKGEISKMRRSYLNRLAAELLTGEVSEGYDNEHMARGRNLEPEAREEYQWDKGVEVRQVGFVRNGIAGCSPDGLVGEDGMLEVKTRLPHLMIDLLATGEPPSEFKAQIQGQLWVCERQWCDLVCYWPDLPYWCKRIPRDEPYIENLAAEVKAFAAELEAVYQKVAA